MPNSPVKSSLNIESKCLSSLDHSTYLSLLQPYKLHPIVLDAVTKSSSMNEFVISYLNIATPIIDKFALDIALNLNPNCVESMFEINGNWFHVCKYDKHISIQLKSTYSVFESQRCSVEHFIKFHLLYTLYVYHNYHNNKLESIKDALQRVRILDKPVS